MQCIACHKPLKPIGPEHPSGGIVCHSHGNYGSTVFDSIYAEERLAFFVCDECLIANQEHILISEQGKPYEPVTTQF